jgi:hypothetical protein
MEAYYIKSKQVFLQYYLFFEHQVQPTSNWTYGRISTPSHDHQDSTTVTTDRQIAHYCHLQKENNITVHDKHDRRLTLRLHPDPPPAHPQEQTRRTATVLTTRHLLRASTTPPPAALPLLPPQLQIIIFDSRNASTTAATTPTLPLPPLRNPKITRRQPHLSLPPQTQPRPQYPRNKAPRTKRIPLRLAHARAAPRLRHCRGVSEPCIVRGR